MAGTFSQGSFRVLFESASPVCRGRQQAEPPSFHVKGGWNPRNASPPQGDVCVAVLKARAARWASGRAGEEASGRGPHGL